MKSPPQIVTVSGGDFYVGIRGRKLCRVSALCFTLGTVNHILKTGEGILS